MADRISRLRIYGNVQDKALCTYDDKHSLPRRGKWISQLIISHTFHHIPEQC